MSIHTGSAYIQNGSIAVGTARGKQFMVVLLTVWFAVVLIEGDVPQLLVTLRASKVLRVPRLLHGIDNLP